MSVCVVVCCCGKRSVSVAVSVDSVSVTQLCVPMCTYVLMCTYNAYMYMNTRMFAHMFIHVYENMSYV